MKFTLPPLLQSKLERFQRGIWLLELAERRADRILWVVVQSFVVLGIGILVIRVISKKFF